MSCNNENLAPKTKGLARQAGEQFVLSTAASAGVWGGLVIASWVYAASKKRQDSKTTDNTNTDESQ